MSESLYKLWACHNDPGAISPVNQVAIKNVLGAIESRLAALESQPIQSDERTEGVIYGLNLAKSMAENLERLNVGSIPGRLLTDIEAMKQDFQCSAQPAETEREWIPLNLMTEVWARKNDGGITRISFGTAINRNHLYTHIMPYHPGDTKPEPPVDNELRGA